MGYDIFQFGALNLDGKIQPVPQHPTRDGDIPQYNGKATISFGTLALKDSISWVKPNNSNLLVADRVLLVKVSWEDLDKNGFVAGKTVLFNGLCFRCRLLQVGEKESVFNEWDKVLDETSEDNDLWHWEKECFWEANISTCNAPARTVRGYNSALYWYNRSAAYRGADVGFRPILEPLLSDTITPNINLDGADFRLSSIPGGDRYCPILQPVNRKSFEGISDGQQLKMYTLMEGGHPIHFGAAIKDARKLTLTDRYFGDEYLVPWVISNGIAVASQSLK